MAKVQQIKTPRGTVTTYKSVNGRWQSRLRWDPNFGAEYTGKFNRKQKFIDSECLRLMEPLTPKLSGAMIKSATLGTVIGSGKIVYIAPYARKQYYTHKAKSYWFRTMKDRYKSKILKGASQIE